MMWVMTMQGALIGLLISALARNADWALSVFPLALIPQLLLAGLLVPVQQRQPFNIVKVGESRTCTDAVAPFGMCTEDAPRWTLAPQMPAVLRYGASPFMAARWGLEAISEMYIHDYVDDTANLQNYGYSFEDLGAVSVTFHSDDQFRIRAAVDQFLQDHDVSKLAGRGRQSDLMPYAAVLGGFAVIMLMLTMAALKRKDYEMTRL
jgi:hypothetical protein